MVNPFADVNWNPDHAEKKKFAATLVIGFPCFAAALLLIWRMAGGTWRPGLMWLGGVGCLIGIVLWLIPAIAKPFYLVWYFVGCCMGFVVGNVVMTAFYYLVMTPMGWLMRVTGRLSFRKGFDPKRSSYWEEAEKEVDSARYYRQF